MMDGASPFEVREAKENDWKGIFEVVEHSYHHDEGCDFKFPFRHNYPDDFEERFMLMLMHYLIYRDIYRVFVLLKDGKIIAWCAWQFRFEANKEGKSSANSVQGALINVLGPDMSTLRDGSQKHMQAYDGATSEAESEFFKKFKTKQLIELLWLQTHEDYWRQGAGTQLLKSVYHIPMENWENCVINLTASALGLLLYKHIGFEVLATFEAKADGDAIQIHAMYMAASLFRRAVGISAR
jgi:GNAT superfamily N-acetyltransferase